MEIIDSPALRVHLGPSGPWAKECGARVTKYRERTGQSETWLAAMVKTTPQTIKLIEAGNLVPRDYLRAAISFALGQDVETIWPPLTRQRVGEIGAMV